MPTETLKAYQVGESGIVAAYTPDGAIKVICEYNGFPEDEYSLDEVVLVSDFVLDGDSSPFALERSLRQTLSDFREPAYVCGCP
ncbi:hypothetical protein ACVTMO_16880 [Pseudomonas segetis]